MRTGDQIIIVAEVYEMVLYFFIYGFLGWCTEVTYAAVKDKKFINRGFLKGPICPIYGVGVVLVIVVLEPFHNNIPLLFITAVILVSLLEGLTGFVLEKVFHNKWWDYSNRRFNIGGYVCLRFSLIWGVACVVVIEFVHTIFQVLVEHLPSDLDLILIIVFGVLLLLDTITTVVNTAKMSKHFAYMESIANELHNISDDIGEDIFKSVMMTIDLADEAKEKVDKEQGKTDDLAETRRRIAILQKQYKEAMENHPQITKQTIKAFPNIDSKVYKQALKDTKKYYQISQT